MRTATTRAIDAEALGIPPDYVGHVTLPGSGRRVFWTGRVAIGLRHESRPEPGPLAQCADWIQRHLLRRPLAPLTSTTTTPREARR